MIVSVGTSSGNPGFESDLVAVMMSNLYEISLSVGPCYTIEAGDFSAIRTVLWH